MKKVSKEKLIEILCNKHDYTYDELASMTGYHPKSLVRINSMIKNGTYSTRKDEKDKIYESIVNDYLSSDCKTYREFYNLAAFKYGVSYSTLCKVLKSVKTEDEIAFIRKVKEIGNYHFEVIDYASESILFTYKSAKNDIKSVKGIIYLLIKNYGSPNGISFVNLFNDVPSIIQSTLDKYGITLVNFKSCYRDCFNNLSLARNIKYRQKPIEKADFYNVIIRKTIADNTIQFDNTRYKIKTELSIVRNSVVMLYYDNSKADLFIKYDDSIYGLTPIKDVHSKKGASKYN